MMIKSLTNYHNQSFKDAFHLYFEELGIFLDKETPVFNMMQDSVATEGLVTFFIEKDNVVIGFIMFQKESFSSKSEFFIQDTLFIREFFVRKEYRSQGIGKQLMQAVFAYGRKKHLKKAILTTHTALDYYFRLGFAVDESYQAKNKDTVLTKIL